MSTPVPPPRLDPPGGSTARRCTAAAGGLAARLAIVVLAAATAAACASSGAVPKPFPGAGTPAARARKSPPPVDASASPRSGIVGTALTQLGVPYRAGGERPGGFDCSGLTQWVFARHGIALPRSTREQYDVGAKVKGNAIKAGDLVFFSTIARGASHVGIALDSDRFVHAPSSRGVVRIERRSSSYWKRRYVGARRVASE